ncbi:competence type IV pilus minor pilin ComGG [Cytobacillus praedii]|uniref:competence type IV pilus minor pilin ComGG n=1 Tax=Cytobacillus praedii TaxID=1742358 RepID=UPI00070CC93C|nr:competence type IV pilus minor pilin ComGG [Cytobacillus praedii]
MIRNENGFTYPLTFCVILLASIVLSIQLELYVSERKMTNETVTMLKQEYYFLSAVKGAEEQFLEEESVNASGVYSFMDGEVNYQTVKVADSLYRVTFRLKIKDLPEVEGTGYYDIDLQKMIKWNEKN